MQFIYKDLIYASDNYTFLIGTTSKNIKNAILHPNTKIIGRCAFEGCTMLTDVKFNESLELIEDEAFSWCTSLNDAKLLYTHLYKIGTSAFEKCIALKRIYLPDTLLEIDSKCFKECKSLDEVYLPSNISILREKTFENCISLKNIIFPKNLQKVCRNAFVLCTFLEELDFSETSAEIIEDRAFENCTRLKSIKLPPKLILLNNSLFAGCQYLKELALPDRLDGIENFAFTGSNIETLILPKNLKTFEFEINDLKGFKNIFYKTPFKLSERNFVCLKHFTRLYGINLRKIKTKIDFKKIFKKDVYEYKNLYYKDKDFTICTGPKERFITEITLHPNTKIIKESAFEDCFILSKVNFNENLEIIEDYAFNYNQSLKEVSFPKSLKYIGKNAFANNINLKSVNLSNTKIEELMPFTFKDCNILSNVSFPNTLKTLNEYSLAETKKIDEFDFSKTSLTTIKSFAFYRSGVINIKFPNCLQKLSGAEIFNSCVNISSIDLKDTKINYLPIKCFRNNYLLQHLLLPENLKEIADCAFTSCTRFKLKTLPKNLEILGSFPQYNFILDTNIYLPSTLKHLGIFWNQPGIEKITFFELPHLNSNTLKEIKNDLKDREITFISNKEEIFESTTSFRKINSVYKNS